MNSSVKEITPRELKERLDSGQRITLVDVREDWERKLCNIGGLHIPMNAVMERESEIPKDHDVVVYCRSGGRSKRVVEALQAQKDFKNLINLAGGILAWGDQLDPSMPQY